MKSWHFHGTLLILLLIVSTSYAYFSDEFTIGTYSYLHSYVNNSQFNESILDLMQMQGRYNASICGNALPASELLTGADNLLEAHFNHGIDPWFTDYHTEYNSSGELISAGAHALSTGNRWIFEAEFFDTGIPSGYPDVANNSNLYLHQFAGTVDNRIGYPTTDVNNIVHRNVWACSPDTAGIALHGLKYRFPKADANNTVSSTPIFDSIGPEFRFNLWDKATWDEPGHLGQHYLSWNKLYVKFVLRVESTTQNQNLDALSFRVYCRNDSTGTNQAVPLKRVNVSIPGRPPTEWTYSFNDITSYSTAAYPIFQDKYRAIVFEIDLNYLRGTNADYTDDKFLNTAGVWYCSLFAIDPYVYSYGNGNVYIDNVEIYDKMYSKLEADPPTEAVQWLNNRFSDYSSSSLPLIQNFYTLDEPQFPLFASYSRLKTAIDASVGSGIGSFATVNWNGGNYKKPNGQRFSLPELLTNPENGFEPEELMIDYYPLNPKNDWNSSTQDDYSGDLTIQSSLDYKMLSHYYAAKKRSKELTNLPLYVVPVCAGRWLDNTTAQDRWDYYMMPTGNMQKCLQLLPLCYGVDGVVNWKLYERDSRSTIEENDYEPYETAGRRGQSNPEVDEVTPNRLIWYAPIAVSGSFINSNTPQFESICQANAKLDLYGKLIKRRNLDWINALCVKNTGAFIGQAYSYIYEEPSNDIGDYLNSVNSYDPQYPDNLSPYQGYTQLGIYEDPNALPYYMIVNRRTDFVSDVSGKMELLTPSQLYTNYNANGIASGFYSAPPQVVSFELSGEANTQFGTFVALYDPFDDEIYRCENDEIVIDVDPGDGKLLQMCAALPDTINADATLNKLVYVDNDVHISNQATVEIADGSKVEFLAASHITIDSGSTLTLRGSVAFSDSVHFSVLEGAVLNLFQANCTFNGNVVFDGGGEVLTSRTCSFTYQDSIRVSIADGTSVTLKGNQLMKQGSKFYVNDSSSLKFLNGSLSRTSNSCQMFVDHSTLEFGELQVSSPVTFLTAIYLTDESTFLCNDSVINGWAVDANNSSVFVTDTSIGYVRDSDSLNIVNLVSDNPTNEFHFSNTIWTITANPRFCTGIKANVLSPLRVIDSSFTKLRTAILRQSNSAVGDSISNCVFTNCGTGISFMSLEYPGTIKNCTFLGTNSCTGIQLSGALPRMKDCQFFNLGIGVKLDQAVVGSSTSSGIYGSQFSNCTTAIESFDSNAPISSSDFYLNETGFLCLHKSNLNLSYHKYNSLRNKYHNIRFHGDDNYNSYIQVITGHNDFYHYEIPSEGSITNDFTFDEYYLEDTTAPINASKNWFEDDTCLLNDRAYEDYVYVEIMDASPNTLAIDPDGKRMIIALNAESLGNYALADNIYRAIINDALPEESDVLGDCIDGVFRISVSDSLQNVSLVPYILSVQAQYAATDSRFCSLLQSYLVKEYVHLGEFQNAIDLIEPRISTPTSSVDSLMAVLELETIMQLASLEEAKMPIVVQHKEYVYNNFAEYNTKHAEHWDQLYKLLGHNSELENVPVPDQAMIASNYPNPFNPSTTIKYGIPADAKVKICVYNIKGQKVKELLNTEMPKGYHSVVWDGKDGGGRSVSSGIYFFRLDSAGKSSVRKAMLMK